MRSVKFFVIVLALMPFLYHAAIALGDLPASPSRERILIDRNWRFALGHVYDPKQDFKFTTDMFANAKAGYGDGAASANFDDRGWRSIDLPHDWANELPFDPHGNTAHGAKRVGRPYPDSSVGWYRYSFDIPASDLGRRISVEFDGAFRDSHVFVNGHDVGRCASGYDGFSCDMSEVLNYGGKNTLAVRLDATLMEGWFYEGAGIYRHVWLVKTAPLHVSQHGAFVTTDNATEIASDGRTAKSADLTVRATLENESLDDAAFDLRRTVIDPDGNTVISATVSALTQHGGETKEYAAKLIIPNPRLWSLESPVLYKLVTTALQNGKAVDEIETPFGIRTLRFDKDQGFFLNDRHVLVKGVCCHQDHAGVGIALPDALQAFRVSKLKEIGCNAIRTSHNPPTPELLDACDRMGMLVLDENRQTGTGPEAMDGLRKLIVRDRNHPSVFLWSLGNEEWAIEGNAIGARVVQAQRILAHQLDPSRLVTTAISGGWGHGSSESVDVMGFNYYTHGNVDDYHAGHADQPCIGTEEASTYSTRGATVENDSRAQLPADGSVASKWGATAEQWINFYDTRPFVAGAFVWTGYDYRGETKPFGWPAISSQYGLLDTCGFRKDIGYYYQSCWSDAPMVHLLPHWNWAGKEGQPIAVRCYSNCDEVELTLNGKSLGRQAMPRHKHLEWSVPYAPGTLTATGFKAGTIAATDVVQTSGDTASVELIPDRAQINSDGNDVAVVTIRAIDAQGKPVATADNLIHLTVTGPGKIIGVGNGDPACHEPDVSVSQVHTFLLSNWRRVPVPDDQDRPEVAESFDDQQWPTAEPAAWDAPEPTGFFVWRTSVDLPELAGKDAKVFLTHAGKNPRIFVNGKPVTDATAGAALRSGRNTIAVISHGVERRQFSASIAIETPAAPWQRSLFNGLAEVIVQSTGESGSISLTATGDGLSPVHLTITAAPAGQGKSK